jgi:integrase
MESHYLPWTRDNQKDPQKDHGRYRKWLAPRFERKPLSQITPLDLERLKREMRQAGMSDATIRHVLSVVRQAFNKAILWGLWQGNNPCKGVKFPVPNNERIRFLTREEAERLLKALQTENPILESIATFSLYGGLRLGEVLQLNWGDVDKKHSILHVVDTKTKEPRPVFIEEPIRKLLDKLDPAKPNEPLFNIQDKWPVAWVSKQFKSVVDSLGFNEGVTDPRQRVYFHTLRHTFASWAVMDGVPLYTVGKALGHKTTTMTQRYAHLAPESQKAAFEAVAKVQPGNAEKRNASPIGKGSAGKSA